MRKFKIGGKSILAGPGWSVISRLNQRATMGLTVVDKKQLSKIEIGDPVQFFNDDQLLFAGLVFSIRAYQDIKGYIYYDVQTTDNSTLADKRLIAKAVDETYAGDLIREYILPILAQEGITEGDIQLGPLIRKAVFNYKKCGEALDYLRDLTGYNWNIDKQKKLNFFSRDTHHAPFELKKGTEHSNFEVISSIDNYRNRQYVRGSQGETLPQDLELPTPKPDGQSRNFILRFPLAARPAVYINSVKVPDSLVGVNGFDEGKQWYFSYNSNVITQDYSAEPLTSTDEIRVTYTGLRNIVLLAESTAAITERQQKENGTSGIYDNIITEPAVKTSEGALQLGNGILAKYGEIKDSIRFITTLGGFEPGQLLQVTKPEYGINGAFLIDSVLMRASGPDHIEYEINALDGNGVGGWESYFRRIMNAGQNFSINADDVVIRIKNYEEPQRFRSTTNIRKLNSLYPRDTQYPQEYLYPGSFKSSRTVSD